MYICHLPEWFITTIRPRVRPQPNSPPTASASPSAKTGKSASEPSSTARNPTPWRPPPQPRGPEPRRGDAFQILRALPHGHAAAALGTLKRLGLPALLDRRRSRPRDLALALIAARLLAPRSKLATARTLAPETASTSLGALLDARTSSTPSGQQAVAAPATSATTPARRGTPPWPGAATARNTLQIVPGLGLAVAVEVFPSYTPRWPNSARRQVVGDRGSSYQPNSAGLSCATQLNPGQRDISSTATPGSAWWSSTPGSPRSAPKSEKRLEAIAAATQFGRPHRPQGEKFTDDSFAPKIRPGSVLLSTEQTVRAYKSLASVETAFRR